MGWPNRMHACVVGRLFHGAPSKALVDISITTVIQADATGRWRSARASGQANASIEPEIAFGSQTHGARNFLFLFYKNHIF